MGVLKVKYDCGDWLLIFSLYNNGMDYMNLVVLLSVVFCFGLVYALYYDDYKDFFKY
jgi:hypothetical protein